MKRFRDVQHQPVVKRRMSHCCRLSSDQFYGPMWPVCSLFLPLASGLLIIPGGTEVGRGTGAVASHGEGEARWGTHDPIPSTRVMIINPAGTAPFNRTSAGQRRRRLRSAWRASALLFLPVPRTHRPSFFGFFFFFPLTN